MNGKQYDILKLELEIVQRQIDKYDQQGATIKAWTVTLWAASLGWSFQVDRPAMILVGIFVALAFWMLDAVNKNFRQDYKHRRDEVTKALQARVAETESTIVTPSFPAHRMSGAFRQMLEPHIFILYSALIIIGLAVWKFS